MKTLRHNLLRQSRTIVVKIGSQVLTDSAGTLDRARVSSLANQIAKLVSRENRRFVLVSSGAIAAGMGKLGLKRRPKSLPDIQALAAVGQTLLLEAYRRAFNRHGIEIAQMLVTREDFQNRRRYLNIVNTFSALVSRGIVPIVNENDSVATHEITFGDNDQLCTLVSHTVHADLVILLSAMEGLIDPETGGAVPYVEQIDRGIRAMITEEKTDRGAGGMHSKIEAVRQLVMSGEPVILADGTRKNVLIDLFREKELGTLFKPAENKLKRKKRWIAFSASPSGDIQIDPGAARALCRNSSLLAIGITAVSGNFRRGAMVRVMHRGREIARGLVNYDSQTIEKIRGLKSSQFTRMLGGSIYEEVIHKDNLVVTAGA